MKSASKSLENGISITVTTGILNDDQIKSNSTKINQNQAKVILILLLRKLLSVFQYQEFSLGNDNFDIKISLYLNMSEELYT